MTIATALDFGVHDYMRKALEHSGRSVEGIADELGVSRQTVGRWINGHVNPSKPVLLAWAQMTGVDYEWLSEKYTPRDLNPEPTDYRLLAKSSSSDELRCGWCGGRHDMDDCPKADDLDTAFWAIVGRASDVRA